MALTDAQKAKCRRYLGRPDVNRSAYSDLEGAFASLSDAGEDEVADLLTQIAALDTARQGLLSGASAGITRVEDVHFDRSAAAVDSQAERTRLIRELGNLLDITPRSGQASGFLARG